MIRGCSRSRRGCPAGESGTHRQLGQAAAATIFELQAGLAPAVCAQEGIGGPLGLAAPAEPAHCPVHPRAALPRLAGCPAASGYRCPVITPLCPHEPAAAPSSATGLPGSSRFWLLGSAGTLLLAVALDRALYGCRRCCRSQASLQGPQISLWLVCFAKLGHLAPVNHFQLARPAAAGGTWHSCGCLLADGSLRRQHCNLLPEGQQVSDPCAMFTP